MGLVQQLQGKLQVSLLPRRSRQAKKITNREGIGSQIALLAPVGGESGAFRKFIHQPDGFGAVRIA
jgi:hypothetical protein